jgi:hypothetical protein
VTLNPNDPLDLQAMREVDALTPQVPALTPTRWMTDEEVDAGFARLEQHDRERAAMGVALRMRLHNRLTRALGAGYRTLAAEDAWVSRCGKHKVTRDWLLLNYHLDT